MYKKQLVSVSNKKSNLDLEEVFNPTLGVSIIVKWLSAWRTIVNHH